MLNSPLSPGGRGGGEVESESEFTATDLQFLSQFCHFSHFNDKSQTKVRDLLSFGSISSNCLQHY